MTVQDDLSIWVESMQRPHAALLRPDGWQLDTLDPARVRRAAVLILFGAREDATSLATADLTPDHLDLLFVRRASSLSHHPGQVAFPGGTIDPGDADEGAAALREAREETGLEPDGVRLLGKLEEVGLPISNFLVTPVLAWWERQCPTHAVDSAETELVFRCSVGTLLDPRARRTALLRRNGFVSRTPAFLTPDAVIWGFTAMVLDAMFDGLGWTRSWDRSLEIPAPL